jgi:hypothetical protein
MRIHDINVVADLNRHNPTGSDPTVRYGEQYTASESEVGEFENLMDTAASSVTADWLEQWWPTILVSVLHQWTPAVELLIQLTIDLLGQVNIVQSVYQLGASYEDIRQQNPNLDSTIEDILRQAQSETFAVSTAWTIASIAQVLAVNPVTFAIFMVAYLAWLILFWNWFMKLGVLLANRVTNIVAANMVFQMMVKIALVGVGGLICTRVLSSVVESWVIRNLGGKVAWLGTVAKWLMAFTCLQVVMVLFLLSVPMILVNPYGTFTGWETVQT